MPRPTKLTSELKGQLLALLRASVPLDLAAPALGICRKTLENWLNRAKAEEEGEFHELGKDIEQAKAQAKLPFIATIARSGRTNSKDAKWMLERTDPQNFERKRVKEHEPEGLTPHEFAIRTCQLVAAMRATVPDVPPEKTPSPTSVGDHPAFPERGEKAA